MRRVVLHVILPLLVLAAGAFGTRQLVLSAETTERETPERIDPLVRVAAVAAYDGPARLVGNGIVEPAREATLSPEVNGRITFVAPSLVEGGRVVQGEELVRIDGRAYRLAIKQSRAQLDRARSDLELEESASKAAKREWQISGREPAKDARRVAHRKPQVDAAEASIASARSALEMAQLDLAKTTVRAPFNATVTSEQIEVGEVAAPGAVLATLVGTDKFWARISVPVEELRLVDFPQGDAKGSLVTVTQELSAGQTVMRQGRVLRLLGSLEAESRTAQLLVEVDRPLDPPPGELPLLRGAFVTAQIEGRSLEGAHSVPRDAVFDGNRVWVVDAEDRLRLRTLAIALSDEERVVATAGVADGDRVVVTPVRTPTEGMKVRVDTGEAEAEA